MQRRFGRLRALRRSLDLDSSVRSTATEISDDAGALDRRRRGEGLPPTCTAHSKQPVRERKDKGREGESRKDLAQREARLRTHKVGHRARTVVDSMTAWVTDRPTDVTHKGRSSGSCPNGASAQLGVRVDLRPSSARRSDEASQHVFETGIVQSRCISLLVGPCCLGALGGVHKASPSHRCVPMTCRCVVRAILAISWQSRTPGLASDAVPFPPTSMRDGVSGVWQLRQAASWCDADGHGLGKTWKRRISLEANAFGVR